MIRLVALRRGHQEKGIRKVAVVLERTAKTPEGKTRVQVWSQAAKRWSHVRTVRDSEIVGDAPADWPQTRAARRSLFQES